MTKLGALTKAPRRLPPSTEASGRPWIGWLCGQRSGTVAQCLNLQRKLDYVLSKLCILRFKAFKQFLIARNSPITLRYLRFPR